ncbi:MAG: S-methyl-5'-thioinosine phosphorylase [Salinisphaera sp.]|nr:S-methyl-5'-thioinosine phosphorylase [Salinisphaera sp.]MDN5937054.1 S-methyl-5'-thioinosine phosphorylase [Salinisphaera sp.]
MTPNFDTAPVAVIGGTALADLAGLECVRDHSVDTPYGAPSGPLRHGVLGDRKVVFLFRHGPGHRIAPHAINYRANIHALADAGAKAVIATAAVGGIGRDMHPGRLVIPHQIIDYSWGRAHSFGGDAGGAARHIDFTEPYDAGLRRALLEAAAAEGIAAAPAGVHGITQGPRLETAAEIERLARDGCDLVGMTGMPEAALAREAGLAYACCAVVVNRAAGRGDRPIHGEIEQHLARGMATLGRLLARVLPGLQAA